MPGEGHTHEDPVMNVAVASRVTRAADGLDRRRFTVAEVEAMVEAGIIGEDERVELIGGELVPMSPKGRHHERVKVALMRRWYPILPKALDLAPETTFHVSDDTYLEPDAVIYPRETGIDGLSPATALLIVEIADSSRRYDTGRKAKLYARSGVRELWVIDAVKMAARTFLAPSASGYGEKRDFAAPERIVPAFAPADFALALDELELA
jgi:Uma2 family endonuclease